MRQLFVKDMSTDRIRFTKSGIEKYSADFARAGFDIQSIRTLPQLKEAVDASFRLKMQTLSSQVRGDDPVLDKVLSGLPGWEPY